MANPPPPLSPAGTQILRVPERDRRPREKLLSAWNLRQICNFCLRLSPQVFVLPRAGTRDGEQGLYRDKSRDEGPSPWGFPYRGEKGPTLTLNASTAVRFFCWLTVIQLAKNNSGRSLIIPLAFFIFSMHKTSPSPSFRVSWKPLLKENFFTIGRIFWANRQKIALYVKKLPILPHFHAIRASGWLVLV